MEDSYVANEVAVLWLSDAEAVVHFDGRPIMRLVGQKWERIDQPARQRR